MEGTLEGRAVTVLDASLNQSGLRKGAVSTSDFIICLLSTLADLATEKQKRTPQNGPEGCISLPLLL